MTMEKSSFMVLCWYNYQYLTIKSNSVCKITSCSYVHICVIL